MLLALTASFSGKLVCGALRRTGHQPPSQLQGFILIAARAITMSCIGSKERGVRREHCVLGLSPRSSDGLGPAHSHTGSQDRSLGHVELAVPVLPWMSHTNPGETFPTQNVVTGQKKPSLGGLSHCSLLCSPGCQELVVLTVPQQVFHVFQEKHSEIWGFHY